MVKIFRHSKSTVPLFGILFLTVVSVSGLYAQDEASQKDRKDEKKRVHIKVITKDNDGKIEKVDTIFRYGSNENDTVITKHLRSQLDFHELADQLKNMDITLDLELDSLDSLAKEVTAYLSMEDFPFKNEFENHPFCWKDYDKLMIPDKDLDNWDRALKDHQKDYSSPYQGDNYNWGEGYTPWGKIREIKVKDKKHGKKIVIQTEENDPFFWNNYYPVPPMPPSPPAVPRHPGKVKKIIIEKHPGEKSIGE